MADLQLDISKYEYYTPEIKKKTRGFLRSLPFYARFCHLIRYPVKSHHGQIAPSQFAPAKSQIAPLKIQIGPSGIAPCKVIPDSIRFWIPRYGFRIPGAGFRILPLQIPDSKTQKIPDFSFWFAPNFHISFSRNDFNGGFRY